MTYFPMLKMSRDRLAELNGQAPEHLKPLSCGARDRASASSGSYSTPRRLMSRQCSRSSRPPFLNVETRRDHMCATVNAPEMNRRARAGQQWQKHPDLIDPRG